MLESKISAHGTWEEDWEASVPTFVEMDFPCFILYRLDERDNSGKDRVNTLIFSHRIGLTQQILGRYYIGMNLAEFDCSIFSSPIIPSSSFIKIFEI